MQERQNHRVGRITMTQERIREEEWQMWSGEKVALRPVAVGDLNQLEAWANDIGHTGEFNQFGLHATGRLARSFAETGLLTEERGLLLVQANDGAIVGNVDYRQVRHGPGASNRAFQIGISLSSPYRGRGYGAEAQRLLTDYLFSTYAIERIEAETDISNVAEQRALERAGFTYEGTLRRAQWRGGMWHDLFLYSKLRGE